MKYDRILTARFVDRPNRFIAHVRINDSAEAVHVKNTGRCRELLLPDAEVALVPADNPNRKTRYDLIAVRNRDGEWVNIDSMSVNTVAGEWLSECGFDQIRPEYVFGESRIDFYMEKGGEKYLLEAKGCTLNLDGIGYFPDAPTKRGVKHIHELIRARKLGYHTAIAFVIAMNGVREVRASAKTDPEFAEALALAQSEGVRIIFITCTVTMDGIVPALPPCIDW